MVVIADVGTGS